MLSQQQNTEPSQVERDGRGCLFIRLVLTPPWNEGGGDPSRELQGFVVQSDQLSPTQTSSWLFSPSIWLTHKDKQLHVSSGQH